MESQELICVCCYCDRDREHTSILTKIGKTVSHGICQDCYDLQMEIYEKCENVLNENN